MCLRGFFWGALISTFLLLPAASPAYAEQEAPARTAEQSGVAPLFSPTPALSFEIRTPQARVTLSQLSTGSEAASDLQSATRRGQSVVDVAMRYIGSPYRWGGTTPVTGFDCSGFVSFVFSKVGLAVSRELPVQAAIGRSLSRDALEPGDLVTFQNTYKPGLSHSGIYVGGGQFVSALDEARGVGKSDLHSEYWHPRFLGGRRIAE